MRRIQSDPGPRQHPPPYFPSARERYSLHLLGKESHWFGQYITVSRVQTVPGLFQVQQNHHADWSKLEQSSSQEFTVHVEYELLTPDPNQKMSGYASGYVDMYLGKSEPVQFEVQERESVGAGFLYKLVLTDWSTQQGRVIERVNMGLLNQ